MGTEIKVDDVLFQVAKCDLASVRFCERLAGHFGHGWATYPTVDSLVELKLPLSTEFIRSAYLALWEAEHAGPNRNLFQGSLGPGIGAPQVLREADLPEQICDLLCPARRRIGGSTATRGVCWAVTDTRSVVWIERSPFGKDGHGEIGHPVIIMEIIPNQSGLSGHIEVQIVRPDNEGGADFPSRMNAEGRHIGRAMRLCRDIWPDWAIYFRDPEAGPCVFYHSGWTAIEWAEECLPSLDEYPEPSRTVAVTDPVFSAQIEREYAEMASA